MDKNGFDVWCFQFDVVDYGGYSGFVAGDED